MADSNIHKSLQLSLSGCNSNIFRQLLSDFIKNPPTNYNSIDAVVDQLARHLFPDEKQEIDETDESVLHRMNLAIEAIQRGEFIVVADREDRENEGDLIIAAEKATGEKIAFMVNETSGLICVGIEHKRAEELQLKQMVETNTESHQTAFTVSVDYKVDTSTGISANDRAATIRALANPNAKPSDFARPGHVFPLRGRDGGVFTRQGHTEASIEISRLAGLYPGIYIY